MAAAGEARKGLRVGSAPAFGGSSSTSGLQPASGGFGSSPLAHTSASASAGIDIRASDRTRRALLASLTITEGKDRSMAGQGTRPSGDVKESPPLPLPPISVFMYPQTAAALLAADRGEGA